MSLTIPTRGDFSAYSQTTTLDKISYRLGFRYNSRSALWMMDIFDADGNILKYAFPLIPNYPLTYKYIKRIAGFPEGQFYIIDETGNARIPDRDTIGKEVNLVYIEAT